MRATGTWTSAQDGPIILEDDPYQALRYDGIQATLLVWTARTEH